MQPAVIGPYKIERELGRGGMGEVFLARDTRLERQVAIKALPAHLAQDADRLTRFQREAKVLASLSHPNIGAIYGLEEADGHQYLILEFIEGETLAERLVNGAIPVEEALSIARQTAEALEVAHEKGIVHRDVKPGNVMVTPEGVVKVLDFGLARTAEGTPSTANMPAAPSSPTVHSPTIPGVILGTAGYMSPEQARGKPVDKRSDIFSFGCVLYEMLTGACPFPGETVTDSLGAILHREPDWTLFPAHTPVRTRELLKNCLAKDRRNRLHDIGDARLELERSISGQEWSQAVAAGSARSTPVRLVAAALGGAVLLGVGWLVGRSLQRPAPVAAPKTLHVSTSVPAKPELNGVVGIAPDATFVVYKAWPQLEPDSATPGGVLVVRRLDRDEMKVIEGTEGVVNAALSLDGRWIAFAASKDQSQTRITLKKVSLDEGRPSGTTETLCDLPAGGEYSLCWSSDREIVLAAVGQKSLLAVPSAGGEPRVVLKDEQATAFESWSDLRPLVPGKSILASRWALVGQGTKERVEVIDLATGTRTPLLQNASGAQMIAGGYVIARRSQNTLIAARLDGNTQQIVDEPVTVWSGGNISGSFFISANGTLAMIISSKDISGRRLAVLDDQGRVQPVAAPARAYSGICVSPDGGRVLTTLEPLNSTELPTDLWIQDLTRGTFGKLPTQGPAWDFIWSNDGQRIAYSGFTSAEFSVWERRADGSGDAVRVYSNPGVEIVALPSAWSPDGKVLAIVKSGISVNSGDVLMLERESSGEAWKATPYLNSSNDEHAMRFSPDGTLVLFCSVESGRHELYVQRFTGTASGAKDASSGRVQVSTTGHSGACWWSKDGKEVRYIDGNQQVMSVEVHGEPNLSASLPKAMYSLKEVKIRNFSWMPDGRLMVILNGENEQQTKIDLVVNFLDELRSKMPAQK